MEEEEEEDREVDENDEMWMGEGMWDETGDIRTKGGGVKKEPNYHINPMISFPMNTTNVSLD